MAPEARHLDRFLSAVRRRVMLIRAAERVGLCAAAACAAALALMPILLWRGEPAMPLALGALAAGALAGLVWTALHRPTLLEAAIEADHQLDLADLLGTALAVRREPNAKFTSDEWTRMLLALAESKCAALSPSMLVLNRLGARAWGGIGLAAALVLTLGLMSSQPRDLRAAGASVEILPRANLDLARATAFPDATSRDRPASARDVTDDRDRTPNDGAPSASASNDQIRKSGEASGASSAAPDSTGGGQSRTDTPQVAAVGTLPPAGGRENASAGKVASGVGEADANASRRAHPSSALGSSTMSRQRDVPPWQADAWNSDRAAAADAIRAGRVDNQDEDIVRDY